MIFRRRRQSPSVSLQPLVVMIDDEEDLCHIVELTLAQYGYAVEKAHDGEAGLELIRARRPGLVILDIKMPDVGGLEVLNQIKKQNKEIPVILLSAYPTYKQDFTTWAAEDYVVKSSDLTELKQVAAKYLSA